MNDSCVKTRASRLHLVALSGLMFVVPAVADEFEPGARDDRARYEISIGTHVWSDAADLKGIHGGSFDAVGYNLGGAIHWPVGSFANRRLLLGVDIALQSNESDIRLFTEDLSLRNLYIGPSLKWVAGHRHRYSVDLGLIYHEVDIAELIGVYPDYRETVIWDETAAGGFIGASLNFNAAVAGKRSGILLAFKAHFVDFEVDTGDPLTAETFGPGSRNLSGPIYSVAIGYRWN